MDETNSKIELFFKEKNVKKLIMYIQINLALVEPLIEYWIKFDGKFQQLSIPAIEKGLIIFPILQYHGQLKNIEEIIQTFQDISYYKEELDVAQERLQIVRYINTAINKADVTLKELHKNLDFDNRLITETTKYLEKFSVISRKKLGNDYSLKKM